MFIVNVEAAIYKDEKWLIVRRSEKEEYAAGVLALVGGKVDKEGNSADILERALIREVEEEVGVAVSNLTYVNSSSFVAESGVHVVDIVFLCTYQAGEPFAKDPEEVASIHWMATEEISSNDEIPGFLKENIQLAEKLVKSNPVFSLIQ
ncbi:NUDIX domain-containing protein [Planomicrobium sp. CPCC 101110]|uniref:NUDIX domain-containing protein n=1 Tax=Planomicrobium sp. CPCC 101110 TaxID=2599619 RepID=UPI0011B7BCF7|nr:NUDIX domain-containing protein [Planomicrobium sp. CPCC 101110]TWT24350.1 NUDIX domain-containing protein [Planomicrobium sp. CPCC 101110]